MKKRILLVSTSLLILISSCLKEDIELSFKILPQEVSLYPDEEFSFSVLEAQGEVIFSIENDYIAEVVKDGSIKAKLVGETVIKAVDTGFKRSASAKILVKPKIALPDPFMQFGVDKEFLLGWLRKEGYRFEEVEGGIVAQDSRLKDVVYMYALNEKEELTVAFLISPKGSDFVNVLYRYASERYVITKDVDFFHRQGFSPDQKIQFKSLLDDNLYALLFYNN